MVPAIGVKGTDQHAMQPASITRARHTTAHRRQHRVRWEKDSGCHGDDRGQRGRRTGHGVGVSDLVGNVWQLTSSFADAHTASVVLKGGSNYFPVATAAAKWYFKNVRESLFTHNKAFLMDDAFERAGTAGFRCVRDVEGQPPVRW